MALSNAQRDIIAHRRRQVARLRLRGLSEREIAQALAAEGHLNPVSSKPWSCATIHDDVKALERSWREAALGDIDIHKGRVLAELAEVRRSAWELQDLERVLKALAQVRALLGLDRPAKVAPTNPEGDREYQPRPELTDEQRLERLAELIGRAHPGESGSDSEDGGL